MARHPHLSRVASLAAVLVLPILVGCGTDYEEPDASRVDTPSTVTTTVPPSSATAPSSVVGVDEPMPLVAGEGSPRTDGDVDEPFDAPTEAHVIPAPDPHQAFREGEAAYARGDHDLAIDLLRSSIAARDEFGHAHYLLGLAYRKTGRSDRAEDALARALDRMPDHHRARVNLARTQLDQGRAEEALSTLAVAIDRSVISDDLRNVEGLALLELGRLEEAEAAFLAAIDIHPGNVYALNNAGLCRIRMGRHADAVPVLTEASLLSGAPAYVWNNLGHALEHEGRVVEARDAFAVAIDAGHASAAGSFDRIDTWLAAHPEVMTTPDLANGAAVTDASPAPSTTARDEVAISVEEMGAAPSDEPLASAEVGAAEHASSPAADASAGPASDDPITDADPDHPRPESPSGSAVDQGDTDDR